MEQCSSQETAQYKSDVIQRLLITVPEKKRCLVDLTGGFGIDFSFLSRCFAKAIYIERNSELAEVALNNFRALGLNHVETFNADSTKWLSNYCVDDRFDCIFVDPSRRGESGERTFLISDCEPDLTKEWNIIVQHLRQNGVVMVKLSPMLDISMAIRQLSGVKEVHVVSVRNECKELLVVLGLAPVSRIKYFAVNITPNKTDSFEFSSQKEKEADSQIGTIGKYLYEPNASIMKIGAFKSLSSAFGITRLHTESHLYSGDNLISGFPGKTFLVKRIFSFNKNDLRELSHIVDRANVTVRNFPDSADRLRGRLGLKNGGDSHIHATTQYPSEKILILSEPIR